MKKHFFFFLFLFLITSSWSQEYKKMIVTGTYSVQEIQQEAETYFNIVGTERGKGYKPYKRWEYNALRNMDEDGMLKAPSFYFNELERYTQYINEKNDAFLKTTTGNWEELGPTSWNRTSGWNPGVGRVTSIAIDRNNNNHIIIGANTGGVWKTIDGGSNWTVLTDNLSNLNVYALAIDPNNSMNYFWGSSSGNIFKSTNGGSTWSFLSDTGNGTVNKILIDPNDSEKIYCSVQGGGIYKSTDEGESWDIIHPFATNGYDIEFKPGNTDIVYATGNQFFKSTDGGATFVTEDPLNMYTQEFVSGSTYWSSSSSNQNNTITPKTGSRLGRFYIGNFSHPITRLITPSLDLTSATNPQLKFSYSNVQWAGDIDELRILYKTSSSGLWTELANYTAEATSWQDIVIDLPNSSSDYYIAFEGKSNYGRGLTLDDVSVEDPTLGILFENDFESDSVLDSGPKMMGVSEHDDSIVYLLEASGSVFGALYKSTDNGDNFTKLNHAGKNYFGYSSTASDDSGQAPRDMDITVNPNDVNEVHIAGVLSWMSTDGGVNFNLTSQWTHTNAAAANVGYCHADIDILEYVDGKLYVGSDGGIFVAENPLTIDTDYYTDLTSGLGIRQFYKIGVNQNDPEIVSGGAQDNGTSVMDINGDWTDWLGADGMESFVDKNDNSILYGTSQGGTLYKSYNGGNSYSGLSEPEGKEGNWVTPFEQDPITQDVIYSGYDEVYKSINGGSSWTSISESFGGNLNHLKIANSNNNIIWAARGSELHRTVDGGTNWDTLADDIGFSGNINSIAIHPTNPNKIAIATNSDQKVYVSSDGGDSWFSYLHDLPNFSALALVWQDNGNNGLYVGMNYGVYFIDDTTPNNWIPFSNNLPNVEISELEINTATSKIYAGTYGRGLWKSDLYDATALSINDFEINTISVYPNPASKDIYLKWNKNDLVTLKLYNNLGSLVYYQKSTSLLASHKIDISNFSSGVYYLKINTVNAVTTKKVIIK